MAGADPFAALSDADPAVRQAAAVELRNAAPPESVDWAERVARITPGMTREQALKQLGEVTPGPGTSSGTSTTETWRLDPYFTVVVPLSLLDDTVLAAPTLQRDVQSVWVAPPEGFSGVWETWYVNGARSHEIHYRNGEYDGAFRSFFASGEPRVQQEYAAGVVTGEDRGWHANGQPSYRGQHRAGARHGTWEFWSEDGTLVGRQSFEAGEEHGVSSRWSPEGQLLSEVHYAHGQKHGRDRAWDDAGKLLWDRLFNRGALVP